MLVDARWPPPDPEPARPRFPWAAVVWPGLTVALLAIGSVVPPLLTYLCVFGALYCAAETLNRSLRRIGGMKDYKQ
jgi:hypothetical protein